MDFKSLLNKLDSMDAPVATPAAPQLPKAVQLNEDAQLRVLSGTSTYVAEAQKKVDEEKSSTGGTIDRSKKGVTKHTQNPDRFSDEPHAEPKSGAKSKSADEKKKDAPEQKKSKSGTWGMEGGKKFDNTKKESAEFDLEKFDAKFKKLVEAKKKKPDDDNDGVPDWADEKPGEDDNAGKKKGAAPKKGVNPFAKKKVKESVVSEISDETKKSYVKKAAADVGKMATGEKDGGKMMKRMKGIEKAQESKMMPKGKKRPVKESIEQQLSFKDLMRLVVESGGQQQIDPVDSSLWSWAQRVASTKLGEGMKADVYAGMVYERMGGRFEMYDVLAEDTK